MTNPASFSIVRQNQVVWVELIGVWNPSVDLQYLTELGAVMNNMRGGPWAMVVDMRQWIVDDIYQEKGYTAEVHLNRLNQKAECWIVNAQDQGDFLVKFLEKAKMPLRKFFDEEDVHSWLMSHGYEDPR